MSGVERDDLKNEWSQQVNINKFSEVLGLWGMERIVSNGDDFVVDALFCLKAVQRFEFRVTCVLGVLVTAEASRLPMEKNVWLNAHRDNTFSL